MNPFRYFEFIKIENKPGNEMWRVGGGYHNYRRYFRIDIGSVGVRIVRRFDYGQDYFNNVYPKLSKYNQHLVDRYMAQLYEETEKNPTAFEYIVIQRNHAVTRERKDLFEKLWAKGTELYRNQKGL